MGRDPRLSEFGPEKYFLRQKQIVARLPLRQVDLKALIFCVAFKLVNYV